jgi:hypothetical protein
VETQALGTPGAVDGDTLEEMLSLATLLGETLGLVLGDSLLGEKFGDPLGAALGSELGVELGAELGGVGGSDNFAGLSVGSDDWQPSSSSKHWPTFFSPDDSEATVHPQPTLPMATFALWLLMTS